MPAESPTTTTTSSSESQPSSDLSSEAERLEILKSVLSTNCLYEILGVPKDSSLERITLRRAYLARSRACHPECVFTLVHPCLDLNCCPANSLTTLMQRMLSRRLLLPMMYSANRHINGYTIRVPQTLHMMFLPCILPVMLKKPSRESF